MSKYLLLPIAAILMLLAACGGDGDSSGAPAPSFGWTANTNGDTYGAEVDPATGSFTFPVAPNSVHYVTKACPGLATAKGLRLRYRIDAEPDVKFLLMQQINHVETPVQGSVGQTPVLYLQRAGDDWTAEGKYETYRWWATFNELHPLAPGEVEITAMFDQRWTAVGNSNSIDAAAAFNAALSASARCGFTFPGETGYGHGVTATGHATFTVLSFEVLQ